MSESTLPLVVLTLLLVATRPIEERWWTAGRLSDRVAAWLIVGRLVVLAAGFGLIVALPLPAFVLLVAIGAVSAFLLEPFAERRLVAARERAGSRSR